MMAENSHGEHKATILDETFKDGLENLIANMGTEIDKRSHAKFKNNVRLSQDGNQNQLNDMYRTDWLAGKVVDIIPDDMTREWRSFEGDIDPEIIDKMVEEEERLMLSQTFNEAHKWSRLYGTSVIVLAVDDGNSPEKPLDLDRIKLGGLKHIKAVDRHRFDVSEVIPESNPLSSNYGLPKWYRFRESTVRIHHSRVLRFDAVKLPFDEFKRNNWNSDSVLDRIYERILDFNIVAQGASSMVHETNLDITKIKGLMTYLQSAEGETLLRKRFTLANQLKSFNNMLLLDQDEDFTTKSNTFAGLPELLDRYAQYLSSATDIPATRLLGNSASGMNATGEGDMKNYYDMIRSLQMTQYKAKLDYLDKIIARSLGIPKDLDLSYEFCSLFQQSDKEVADTELVQAQRDQIYIDRDIVKSSVIAKELKQRGTYTNISDEDIEEMEEYENEPDANPEDFTIPEQQQAESGEEEESESGQDTEESGSQVP